MNNTRSIDIGGMEIRAKRAPLFFSHRSKITNDNLQCTLSVFLSNSGTSVALF